MDGVGRGHTCIHGGRDSASARAVAGHTDTDRGTIHTQGTSRELQSRSSHQPSRHATGSGSTSHTPSRLPMNNWEGRHTAPTTPTNQRLAPSGAQRAPGINFQTGETCRRETAEPSATRHHSQQVASGGRRQHASPFPGIHGSARRGSDTGRYRGHSRGGRVRSQTAGVYERGAAGGGEPPAPGVPRGRSPFGTPRSTRRACASHACAHIMHMSMYLCVQPKPSASGDRIAIQWI